MVESGNWQDEGMDKYNQLRKNAEVVHLTSYAPLMAHSDGWQWTPDLLWFNNLESYGTPNYYVQKLFATHRGTDLISIAANNEPLTGQNDLYASAVKDSNSLYLKLVNTSDIQREVSLDLKGVKLNSKGKVITLKSNDLEAVNSFEAPKGISPVKDEIKVKNEGIAMHLPVYSLTEVKLEIR